MALATALAAKATSTSLACSRPCMRSLASYSSVAEAMSAVAMARRASGSPQSSEMSTAPCRKGRPSPTLTAVMRPATGLASTVSPFGITSTLTPPPPLRAAASAACACAANGAATRQATRATTMKHWRSTFVMSVALQGCAKPFPEGNAPSSDTEDPASPVRRCAPLRGWREATRGCFIYSTFSHCLRSVRCALSAATRLAS